MNLVNFISAHILIIFFTFWIHGLSHVLPPERCYSFYLKASAPFQEAHKQPPFENLQKIIDIITVPNDPTDPIDVTCNETAVTLQNITFTSSCTLNKTKLDLIINIEPNKNVKKSSAYYCGENMLYQGSAKVFEVERFLSFRDNNTSWPHYVVDLKACCKDQDSFDEPCCRKGYTLENLTCVKNTDSPRVIKKDEVVNLDKETGEDCEPNDEVLSTGVIIIITCGSLILLVAIILSGLRVWKRKHGNERQNDYVVTHEETSERQDEERQYTGEIPHTVAIPVTGETADGYVPMRNLSRANLLNENNTMNITNNVSSNTNNSDNNANTNNANTSTANNDNNGTIRTNRSSDEREDNKRRSGHPKSRAESLLDFNMHIPIEAIEFTNTVLGRGQFGQVELANVTINGIRTKCAVKMIRGRGTYCDERDLFEELVMLYQIPHHPNVVSLLGGCMDEDSPLYVVVEYCEKGNLLRYLHNNRCSSNEYVNYNGPSLDFRWKLSRAIEICKGMIFLAQRQIIHRDLAARNILLDENEVAKISDFGMARDVYLRGHYIKKTSGFLPVRWMAIEAIESSIYTIKSDMWSFGILLWEIFMDGRTPYPELSDGSKLGDYLQKGYRMAQPDNCPDSFYQLMVRCWMANPEDRPQFTQTLRELEVLREDEMRRESESSRVTEISNDLPMFEDDGLKIHPVTSERQPEMSLEEEQPSQDEVLDNGAEAPVEIGVLNRGRKSIDLTDNVISSC